MKKREREGEKEIKKKKEKPSRRANDKIENRVSNGDE
jgi:hypothetical protein